METSIFMEKDQLRKTILASLFMALAFILPFTTGGNPALGAIWLPMHIPILLCGLVCGPKHGMTVGFMSPILRTIILGAPPPPMAIAMAVELAAYGFFMGLFYKLLPKKHVYVFVALILSLIVGRLAFIAINFQMLSLFPESPAFNSALVPLISTLTLTAWPGIAIQLALVPSIFIILKHRKLLPDQ